jgi:cytochrome c oxidase subunit IV
MTTHHVVPVRLYLLVFTALVLLTVTTVVASHYDLGGGRLHYANAIAAITIAVTKATLVILYFMHVRYSNRLIWVFVGAGAFWMVILLVLLMADFLTRSWLPIATWGG